MFKCGLCNHHLQFAALYECVLVKSGVPLHALCFGIYANAIGNCKIRITILN
jgi:hypothetical protein